MQIRKIAKKNDWEVVTDVHITLLSFLKINMYKDLENNKDKIVSNPTIKALSGDKSEIVPSLSYFDQGLTKYMNTTTSSKLTKTNVSTGTYSSFVTSITTGLNNKAPIVMLTYLDQFTFPDPESFNLHWITITKYFKDNNTQIEYFACSSWGNRYSLYLNDYYLAYDCSEGAYYK